MTSQVPSVPEYALAPPPMPHTAYPTAPPWAPTAPPPPPPAIAPYGVPVPEYGQLLVRYPDEMQNAGRAKAPAWWPVVLLTLLFTPFGAVSAYRRAKRARRGRNNRAPYWIAFLVSLLASVMLTVMTVPVAVAAYLGYRENASVKALQSKLRADETLRKDAQVTVTSARCLPVGDRGKDGLRRYSCLLMLQGGGTGTIDVRAEIDGDWQAVPAKKR